ncbi:hypothetical protein LNTAR_06339 [Lentisphaera araneosa HTCC2155]|uniref:Uncharacterized protein n=1 Tax=Lentisphaera araneosa HTCC2155 TaxID=313628 RepID=A6DN94_9BACT|nr:hypothetical protein [Lentisphaera araneosa]EDM26842.1 hypothetical protein LNTAR_06339 [Lentisphaera araneosa HTCC2155]
MSFIFFIIAWTAGIFIGSFFLIQPMIVLFFGIPFTLKLKAANVFKTTSPLGVYFFSLIVLTGIFTGFSFGVLTWFPNQIIPYCIGVGIVFLKGLSQLGANQNNINDYIKNNASIMDIDKFEKATGINIQNDDH